MSKDLLDLKIIINHKNEFRSVFSTNGTHYCYLSRRISSNEYRKYTESIIDKLSQYSDISDHSKDIISKVAQSDLLGSIDIEWYTDIYYKNGNIKRIDTTNIIKPVEDILASWTTIDDKYHYNVSASKHQRTTDYDLLVVHLNYRTDSPTELSNLAASIIIDI